MATTKKNWIAGAIKKPGALKRELGVKAGKTTVTAIQHKVWNIVTVVILYFLTSIACMSFAGGCCFVSVGSW